MGHHVKWWGVAPERWWGVAPEGWWGVAPEGWWMEPVGIFSHKHY